MTGKSYRLVQPKHLGAIAVWKADDGSAIYFFACSRAKGQNSVAMLTMPKLSVPIDAEKTETCR